jgi:hypothetical protein
MNTTNEFNHFEVDNNVISQFVYSQNGNLGKAIVELITNSIDANAKECNVIIKKNMFSVKDDGEGFKSKKGIMRNFKTFGTPHKEGDAKFGRFRVGRGQVMQFGKISWISNEHEMITDVENEGYGFVYKQLKGKNIESGCAVNGELYKDLERWDLTDTISTIKNSCRFLDVPVRLNGKLINSKNNNEHLWDIDNENFQLRWIKNDSGEYRHIKVYNLGSLVKEIHYSEYGLSAEIVSKKSFILNVSRNEISDNDPVWMEIKQILIEKSRDKVTDFIHFPKSMKEKDRYSIKHQIEANMIDFKVGKELPIFKCFDGKYKTILDLINTPEKVTIAPNNTEETKREADAINTQGIGIILHHDELIFWGKNRLQELMAYLLYNYPLQSKENYSNVDEIFNDFMINKYLPFEALADLIDSNNKILEKNDLTERELSARHALASGSKSMANCLSNIDGLWKDYREIKIGTSDTSDGWTDSHSFIAVNRRMLKLLDKGRVGSIQLTTLLLHEYCHDKNNSDNSIHGLEFYERYHDLISRHGKYELLTRVSNIIYKNYIKQLIKRELKLPKYVDNEKGKTNENVDTNVVHYLDKTNTADIAFSDKGISNFAKKAIAILKLNKRLLKRNLPDHVGCCLEIKYTPREEREYGHYIYEFIEEKLLPQMKMEPLSSFNKLFSDESVPYKKISEAKKEHLKKACIKYAKRYKYDEKIVIKFFSECLNNRHFVNIRFLIEIIMEDSYSDLLEYTIDQGDTVSTRGSKHYLYNNENYVRICGSSEMATQSDARIEHALDKIKETLDCIKNKEERNEVIEILKTDDFISSL